MSSVSGAASASAPRALMAAAVASCAATAPAAASTQAGARERGVRESAPRCGRDQSSKGLTAWLWAIGVSFTFCLIAALAWTVMD